MACVVGAAVGVVVPKVEQGEGTVSDTETKSVTELEKLLEAEIPCDGIRFPRVARTCSAVAVLRTDGHGCPLDGSGSKCMTCWKIWYQAHADMLARNKGFRCWSCNRLFRSIEAFSDYRPF